MKAVDFFEKAIVEDAQYALAHSGLADAYGLLAHYGVTGTGRRLGQGRLQRGHGRDAGRPVRRSPHLAGPREVDAGLGLAGRGEGVPARLSLDPHYPTAHHWYAMSCLAPMGRLDDARDQMQLAQSLDPVSAIIARDLTMVHYYRRDFEAALDQCDHTIELEPALLARLLDARA